MIYINLSENKPRARARAQRPSTFVEEMIGAKRIRTYGYRVPPPPPGRRGRRRSAANGGIGRADDKTPSGFLNRGNATKRINYPHTGDLESATRNGFISTRSIEPEILFDLVELSRSSSYVGSFRFTWPDFPELVREWATWPIGSRALIIFQPFMTILFVEFIA